MTALGGDAGELFLAHSIRKLEQMTSHIETCLLRLNEGDLWERGGRHENAIGNLVLHLPARRQATHRGSVEILPPAMKIESWGGLSAGKPIFQSASTHYPHALHRQFYHRALFASFRF